jgi:hypothetical protein
VGVTFIALGLLACAWAVLLVPDLRNRGGSSHRSNSVKSFRDHLSGLDRTRPPHLGGRPTGRPSGPMAGPVRRPVAATRPVVAGPRGPVRAPVRTLPGPRSPLVPRSAAEAARRRSLVLAALVGLAFVTLVGGLVGPRALLFVHLLVDAALAGFAYLLWERSARSRLRGSSLVTLSRVDDDGDDVVLRREATGS